MQNRGIGAEDGARSECGSGGALDYGVGERVLPVGELTGLNGLGVAVEQEETDMDNGPLAFLG